MVESFLDTPNKKRWWNAMWFALGFLAIANPVTYGLVNSLLSAIVRMVGGTGYWYFADALGCPTRLGFTLHFIVFFFLARLIIETRELDETPPKNPIDLMNK